MPKRSRVRSGNVSGRGIGITLRHAWHAREEHSQSFLRVLAGGLGAYRFTESQHKTIEIFDDDLAYIVDSIRWSFPNHGATLAKLGGKLVDAADPEISIVRAQRANARMARSARRQAVEKEFNVIASHGAPLGRVCDKVTDGKAEAIAVVVHRGENIGH